MTLYQLSHSRARPNATMTRRLRSLRAGVGRWEGHDDCTQSRAHTRVRFDLICRRAASGAPASQAAPAGQLPAAGVQQSPPSGQPAVPPPGRGGGRGGGGAAPGGGPENELNTRPPNGVGQTPAFEGQTRAPEQKLNVAFDVVTVTEGLQQPVGARVPARPENARHRAPRASPRRQRRRQATVRTAGWTSARLTRAAKAASSTSRWTLPSRRTN